MIKEIGYNGRNASVLDTLTRSIHAADGGRHAMPEDHPTKPNYGMGNERPIVLTERQQQRFWKRVPDRGRGGCWDWRGVVNEKSGYGYLTIGNRQWSAHRTAWTLTNGAIPNSLTVDHLCRNRKCVNPAHMAIVSPKENTLRGYGPTAVNARKTHCIHGHELTPDNIRNSSCGWRVCRKCHRVRRLATKLKRRARGLR